MVYAEQSALRARQVVGDGLLLLWVVVWVRAGFWVHEQVGRLGTPPATLQDAGREIQGGGLDG